MVPLPQYRALEVASDQATARLQVVTEALTHLVDALLELPAGPALDALQAAHLRLTLRAALRVLETAG
jgi:hypothetical protein